MLQHMEQGCQPRSVLRRLGRDIAHAAKCTSRAQFALDLVVKTYPPGSRLRRQIEHGRGEAAVRVGGERLREQLADAHPNSAACGIASGAGRQARVPCVLLGHAIRKRAMKPVPRGSVPARSRKPRNASGWTISPKMVLRSPESATASR